MVIYQVTTKSPSEEWPFYFMSYKDATSLADNDTWPEHRFVVEFEFELTDGELVYTSTTEE